MPLAQVRALLVQHLAKRPDHLAALAPDAPKEVRDAFTQWAQEHHRLRIQEAMAESADENVWRDPAGNIVPTPYWGKAKDGPSVIIGKNRAQRDAATRKKLAKNDE